MTGGTEAAATWGGCGHVMEESGDGGGHVTEGSRDGGVKVGGAAIGVGGHVMGGTGAAASWEGRSRDEGRMWGGVWGEGGEGVL